MYNGLLHLHNTLRWVVLIALIISIYKLFTQKDALKTSKTLLMSAHASLLVGLYQYIAGRTDNLVCAVLVLEDAVVVKTVMHEFVLED